MRPINERISQADRQPDALLGRVQRRLGDRRGRRGPGKGRSRSTRTRAASRYGGPQLLRLQVPGQRDRRRSCPRAGFVTRLLHPKNAKSLRSWVKAPGHRLLRDRVRLPGGRCRAVKTRQVQPRLLPIAEGQRRRGRRARSRPTPTTPGRTRARPTLPARTSRPSTRCSKDGP